MRCLLISDSAACTALVLYRGVSIEMMYPALRNLLLMAWGAFVFLVNAVRSLCC